MLEIKLAETMGEFNNMLTIIAIITIVIFALWGICSEGMWELLAVGAFLIMSLLILNYSASKRIEATENRQQALIEAHQLRQQTLLKAYQMANDDVPIYLDGNLVEFENVEIENYYITLKDDCIILSTIDVEP